jgi:hypothetical protein
MAAYTRVNGLGHSRDVLYSTLQLKAFKIVIDNDETNASEGIGGLAEAIAQEFGTTAALFEVHNESVVFVGDGHALDINTIARRCDRLLGAIAGDGTLTGAGTTARVTVTELTSLFGIA